jgi:hypothetical protein
MRVSKVMVAIVRWHVDTVGASGMPFYFDEGRVGAFAVAPDELAAGTDAAVFRRGLRAHHRQHLFNAQLAVHS